MADKKGKKTDSDYFDEFKNSKWAAMGSDPNSEARVKEDFDGKLEKAGTSIPKKFLKELRLLYDYLLSGKDLGPKALIVGALLYFISPVDLIPDFIPVAGYIDDAAVVAGVVALLSDLLKRFEKERKK